MKNIQLHNSQTELNLSPELLIESVIIILPLQMGLMHIVTPLLALCADCVGEARGLAAGTQPGQDSVQLRGGGDRIRLYPHCAGQQCGGQDVPTH